MQESNLTSIKLIVPGGERLADVTPNWHVQIDGQLQSGYTTEEGLIFAAFSKHPNAVLKIEQLPKIIMSTYEFGLEQGAPKLSFIEQRPNKPKGGELRTLRIKAIIDHILQARRGPLASSLYQFRSQPISYLLCTDITTEELGLESIAEQSGKNVDTHAAYFVAQRKKRVEQEQKHTGGKPVNVAPKSKQNLEPRHEPKPLARVLKRGPALYTDPETVQHITREKLLAVLHGDEGTITRTVEVYYDLVNNQGFSRRDAERFLNTIDRFIAAGYLRKAVDPKNEQHAVYVRTAEPIRIKQS